MYNWDSCGWSPVNWLSQTRRNLATEFLNLNFASRRKLCLNLTLYIKKDNTVVLILCEKIIIFLRLDSLTFRKCIPHSSLYDIDALRDSFWDLKFSRKVFKEFSREKCWQKTFWCKDMMPSVSGLRKRLALTYQLSVFSFKWEHRVYSSLFVNLLPRSAKVLYHSLQTMKST